MNVGALDGVQAQQQRHGALAPPQALLGIRAQLLILRRLGQHQHVGLEVLAHFVDDLEVLQRAGSAHREASVVRLDGGCGGLLAGWRSWKHQAPASHTRASNGHLLDGTLSRHASNRFSGCQHQVVVVQWRCLVQHYLPFLFVQRCDLIESPHPPTSLTSIEWQRFRRGIDNGEVSNSDWFRNFRSSYKMQGSFHTSNWVKSLRGRESGAGVDPRTRLWNDSTC